MALGYDLPAGPKPLFRLDFSSNLTVAAHGLNHHSGANPAAIQQADQIIDAGDGFAVERHDQIPRPQPGAGGGTIGRHLKNAYC